MLTLTLLLWQSGCQSPTNATDASAAPSTADGSTSAAAVSSTAPAHADGDATASKNTPAVRVSPEDLPTPPGVDRIRLLARRGESLEQARMTLPQILASLPEDARTVLPKAATTQPANAATDAANVAATQPADAAESDEATPRELPRAAALAYIAGRIALNENRMQTAILQLKIALGIAPNEPDIARLLATAYLRIGNRPAASMYLQQALRSDPDDIDSLIKFGRSSLERGEWAQAIVIFDRSLELAKKTDPRSPALEQICEFYLGSALEVGRFDQASIKQYLSSMDGRRQLTDMNAARYQMMLLGRQFGVVWQAVGDAQLRLGKPELALEAYNEAVKIGVSDLHQWMARYVYTQLLLGKPDQATMRMTEFLKSKRNDTDSLPLVKYLLKYGGNSRALAQSLQKIYDESDKSAAMAQMISSMLPAEKAQVFLLDHLKDRPADLDVATEVIRSALHPTADSKTSPATSPQDTPATVAAAADALRLVAKLINQNPAQATAYANAYLVALNGKPALTDIVAKLDATKQAATKQPAGGVTSKSTAVRFIVAADYLRKGQLRHAQPLLEAITHDDSSFMPARILLSAQLTARGRWDEAAALLEGMTEEPWLSKADNLRVRILAGKGQVAEAITLLDGLIARETDTVPLTLYKANLQAQSGQAVQGERTLLDLLNVHPRDERIYKQLFDMYDRGDVPDVSTQYQRLMIRLFETIPHSRLARLQQVDMLLARREIAQAQAVLRDMIAKDEKDYEAVGTLARVLHENDRVQDADKLIKESLAGSGDDVNMLRLAAQYYQVFKQPQKSFEIRLRLAGLLEDPFQRATSLAVLYLQQDKLDEAKRQALIAISGDSEDPQGGVNVFLHVMTKLVDVASKDKRQALLDEAIAQVNNVIKKFPDTEADLRYEVASFHARLGDEEASLKAMERTVEKFPDHAPSNNGLGYSWADKGIHLQKAQAMIQKAVDADPQNIAYLDSLGWVYYKLGKFDDAVRWLSQAATGRGSPSPVILDHLGDALYRSGNQPKAMQIWRQAQRLLQSGDFSSDPEAARLPQAIQAKLDAVSKKQVAPVAPVPLKVDAL